MWLLFICLLRCVCCLVGLFYLVGVVFMYMRVCLYVGAGVFTVACCCGVRRELCWLATLGSCAASTPYDLIVYFPSLFHVL